MILLDTHIWVWWVHGDLKLTREIFNLLEVHENSGFGVSVMSCWEVAKLCEVGRLVRLIRRYLQTGMLANGVTVDRHATRWAVVAAAG